MASLAQEFVARQLKINKRRRLLHPPLRRLIPLFSKLEVRGLENIPTSGATMLIGNHISLVDPIFFTAAVQQRYVISMAKAEALNHPIQGLGLRIWGNFVINRGEVDRKALSQAIELIKAEQLVWIAPEGTRNPNGMAEAKSGITYIAHKANAIIVPSAICGAADWATQLKRFNRVQALITFGRPFRLRLPEGERLSRTVREHMMQEAMYQLALTIPETYAQLRGVYKDIDRATTNYLEFV